MTMMKRLIGLAVMAVVTAACTSTDSGGVASADTASSIVATSSSDLASVESTVSETADERLPGDAAPNGDYLVGTDIVPGVWQCRMVGDSVYWETTDKAGGIISNDLGSIARIDASAFAVKLKGCNADWVTVVGGATAEIASTSTPTVSSGSGSAARDTDIVLCHDAFGRFAGELRNELDAAVVAGQMSPVNLWFAASTFGSVNVGNASDTIARKIGDFNASALLLTQEGVLGMSDEGAQNFMQGYYDMRTACEDINAWL